MKKREVIGSFFRSREGAAFLLFLVLGALASSILAYDFYRVSLRSFAESSTREAVTALRLIDSFASNYSDVRGKLGASGAPGTAVFRARAIALFDAMRKGDDALRVQWVGGGGQVSVADAGDKATADAIGAIIGRPNPGPHSEFVTVAGQRVFRTVFPSVAWGKSCVACGNALQADRRGRSGSVTGAFVIDTPAATFLNGLISESLGIGIVLFFVIADVGLWISLMHHRRIREAREAQRRLEASERRFRDFAEASSDWFWEQDENLRISFVSENEISKRLGSTPVNQLGRSRREIVTLGVSEEQWAAHEADQLARRPFQNFRFQRIDANGELRHVELNGKPIFDAEGNFHGYRGTAKDVTVEVANELELTRRVAERTAELQRAQEELLRKEKLSTLGQFTATVAHELRNPLSAIRNTAFAIAESAAARGLRLDRPMARLERSIGRCDRLIGDLLEYTRIRELKLLPLPLPKWLGDVLDEHQLPDGVPVMRDFDLSGPVVEFDPDRLQRVIINLVDNAAHALAELPPERDDRAVTVRARITDATATIIVEDNGPGIAPEVLPRVFDPLFSTKSFGTGLGLPTVKQIVEQHGGTIAITSRPGSGTQVTVTLPLQPASAPAELAA